MVEFEIDLRVQCENIEQQIKQIVDAQKTKNPLKNPMIFFACQGPMKERNNPLEIKKEVQEWTGNYIANSDGSPKAMNDMLKKMMKKFKFTSIQFTYPDLKISVILDK